MEDEETESNVEALTEGITRGITIAARQVFAYWDNHSHQITKAILRECGLFPPKGKDLEIFRECWGETADEDLDRLTGDE